MNTVKANQEGLFECLNNCNPNHDNLLFTLLDVREHCQKALLSGGNVAWESSEEVFFAEHCEELKQCRDSGIQQIAGRPVYCEVIGNQNRMVICGAGHISIALIKIAQMLGFEVAVIDDRPMFANNARLAGAENVFCDNFEQALERIDGNSNTYFIIVTRGHRHDMECLRAIAEKAHAYIGMIGSKTRVSMVKQTLLAEGTNPEALAALYSPIGLKIGAQTPEEIAVSILAEIIDVKSKHGNWHGYSRELLKELRETEGKESRVLATIIHRKGSAPRETGAKMLCRQDGTILGTIGGGCAEAEVLAKARRMLCLKDQKPIQIVRVDMTNTDAEKEGMVCGGVIDVLLERI